MRRNPPRRMPPGAGALALLLLGLSWLGGCGPKLDEKTMATVNGIPITVQEVDERYSRLERELETQPTAQRGDAQQLKRAVLQELINRKLLLAEAAARRLVATDADVDQEENRLSASLSAAELKEVMAMARLTPERFRASLREDLLIRRLTETLTAGVSVAEKEIAEAYEKGKSQFYRQEMVRARQMVLSTEGAARQAKRRLAAGEDFEIVAREVSQSPDAKKGGDLGFFQRGQMPSELEEWAFQLKPGQVSPVIETPYGFHVLKVEEQKPAKQLDPAEARDTIIGQITARKREERYRAFLSGLQEKANIAYNRKYADLKPKKKK